MIGQDMVNRLYDCQVVDPAGEKIGSVERVWLDGRTGDPLWASVHTGLFGLKESFVPLQRAELANDQLRVPVDKDQVKESPKIEAANDHLSDDEQAALYQHYGFGPQGGGRQQRRPGMSQQPGEYPSRGRQAQQEVTLHAEKPVVETETVPVEQVRLATEKVTEEETVSGTVGKEKIDVEDGRDRKQRH